MAWILLNIHRATEAMGRAAVFYSALVSQASSLSAVGMLCPENLLALSHAVRQANEDND